MKIVIIFALILILLIAVIITLSRLNSKPISAAEASARITSLLTKTVNKKKTVTGAIVLLESREYGLNETFSAGTVKGEKINPDQPFHVASIGKSFTAALIGGLADEGQLNLEDRISDYLPPGILSGLFNIDGTDYSKEVKISQLLNHTSGVADFFEDPAKGSKPIQELVIEEPDRFWTPEALLAFSRDHQAPIGKPGEKFHYSDTGYVLLGLMIEKVSGKSFHEVLHEKIFNPLGMNDSYLMLYSEPANEKRTLCEIWFKGVDVSGYKSASIDWAGGGIVSTANDLAIFVRALNQGKIISSATLEKLYSFDNKFMMGIRYGMGFMEYHFKEFFPTLGAMPKLRGHMGSLGTQMLYDGKTDTVFIASFGSSDYPGGSVRTMIKILGYAMRIKD